MYANVCNTCTLYDCFGMAHWRTRVSARTSSAEHVVFNTRSVHTQKIHTRNIIHAHIRTQHAHARPPHLCGKIVRLYASARAHAQSQDTDQQQQRAHNADTRAHACVCMCVCRRRSLPPLPILPLLCARSSRESIILYITVLCRCARADARARAI